MRETAYDLSLSLFLGYSQYFYGKSVPVLPKEVENQFSSLHFLFFLVLSVQLQNHIILLIWTISPLISTTSRRLRKQGDHYWVWILTPSFQRVPLWYGLRAAHPPACHLLCSASCFPLEVQSRWETGMEDAAAECSHPLGWERWVSYPPKHPWSCLFSLQVLLVDFPLPGGEWGVVGKRTGCGVAGLNPASCHYLGKLPCFTSVSHSHHL